MHGATDGHPYGVVHGGGGVKGGEAGGTAPDGVAHATAVAVIADALHLPFVDCAGLKVRQGQRRRRGTLLHPVGDLLAAAHHDIVEGYGIIGAGTRHIAESEAAPTGAVHCSKVVCAQHEAAPVVPRQRGLQQLEGAHVRGIGDVAHREGTISAVLVGVHKLHFGDIAILRHDGVDRLVLSGGGHQQVVAVEVADITIVVLIRHAGGVAAVGDCGVPSRGQLAVVS